ncbi:uncharacterized protein LOC126369897 [Pectinophora gossypiella]|uniref:uncharacterized protein LOC126369897 n=1 Tax=Pectinophora gossypiella TaxID=13191 RepID=UPI00214DFDE3|nr:uncharacterized protein LOC126369897 [Pectinophora gossypiella]
MSDKSECDVVTLVGLVLVFSLPLTLLVPGFSVWDVVPKFRISRFHVISQYLTWPQLNTAVIVVLVVFFCLFLEIRKRKLDDMVEKVLTVSQATDKTMEVEKDRQAAAVRVCVDLLDASAEHYEHLVLFRDDLRRRKHQPPTIEPSSSM